MASLAECEAAFADLAAKLAGVDDATRKKALVDRTVSCSLPDLGAVFTGRLHDGHLVDIARQPEDASRPQAQLRLSVASDDLIALTEGTLPFTKAWSSGRLRIEANVFDLLKLRSLL